MSELYRVTFFFTKEGQVCTKNLSLEDAQEFESYVDNCYAENKLCTFLAEGMNVKVNLSDIKCIVTALIPPPPEPVAELPPVVEPVVQAA